jgi:hypothetical protein
MEETATTKQKRQWRPVAPTLRAMEVGETRYFGFSQYSSVRAAVANGLLKEYEQGWRYKVRLDRENLRTEAIRVS